MTETEMNVESVVLSDTELKEITNARTMGDLLIVQLYPKETHTAGGIEIPELVAKNRGIALVRLVGPDSRIAFETEDTVIFALANGEPIPELGDGWYSLKAQDVVLHYRKGGFGIGPAD